MAFNTVQSGADMIADNVQQIIDAWEGVSGSGQQMSLTQYNSSSNYALTIRNLDTSNGYGLKVTDAADATLLLAYKNNVRIGASSSDTLAIACKTYIGDTANTKNIYGLTVNQAAGVDEIVSAKASYVDHGMTALTETDTYGSLKAVNATSGGLALYGYTDATDTPTVAVQIYGTLGNAASATKSTDGKGVVNIIAAVKATTANEMVAADGNLVTIANGSVTRFIFDADGDFHYDATAAAFDEHEDALAVADLARVTSGRDELVERYDKAALRAMKILHYDDADPTGRVMVSHKSKDALMQGAIMQQYERANMLERQLVEIRSALRTAKLIA